MKNIPEKIYLQIGDDCDSEDFNELSEVSWNKDKIYENDIEFTLQNKVSDISAEEESEYELLLMVKNELLAADKLSFAERVKANEDILNFVSIKRKPIIPDLATPESTANWQKVDKDKFIDEVRGREVRAEKIKERFLSAYYAGFNQAHYSHVHPEICEPKECQSAGEEYMVKNEKYINSDLEEYASIVNERKDSADSWVSVEYRDTNMILTNESGDTFTIPDTRRNESLRDFFHVSQPKEESEKELEERTDRNMNVISDFCEHVKSEVGLVIPESAILSFFNA